MVAPYFVTVAARVRSPYFTPISNPMVAYASVVLKRHPTVAFKTERNRTVQELLDLLSIIWYHSSMKKHTKPKLSLTFQKKRKLAIENGTFKSIKPLRKFLIENFPDKHFCEECNQSPIWNCKPLVLQLDHKDGCSTNHKLENLRWLCPNCHSQTHNFGMKNMKISKEEMSKRVSEGMLNRCKAVELSGDST